MIAQLPDQPSSAGSAYLGELSAIAGEIEGLGRKISDNLEIPTLIRRSVEEFLEGAAALLNSAAEALGDDLDMSPVACAADVQSAAVEGGDR